MDWGFDWLKLSASTHIDVDRLTLDQFVNLVAKLELLKLWQSDKQKEQDALSIHALNREMQMAQMAGVNITGG